MQRCIGEGFYTKFAKPKIVSPTAMAKLAIDSDRLESHVINREIMHSKSGDREIFIYFIKNREISRQIARLGSSATLTVVMCNTSQCKLRSTFRRVTNVICIVAYRGLDLYRDVWIAAITSSRASLATLTGVGPNV